MVRIIRTYMFPHIAFKKYNKKYKISIFCDGELFYGKDREALKQRLKKSINSGLGIKILSRNREQDDESHKSYCLKVELL